MKLDLLLEHQGGRVLFAWARETSLGVYMGVRFSPGVENASYFKDGQRQLLRFPLTPGGKRKREEVPLDPRSPIASIQTSELLLERAVDVSGEASSNSPAHEVSAGTTEVTIPQVFLGDCRYLYYEAHLVRNEYMKAFLADKESDPACQPADGNSSVRLFPLVFFPEHSLALVICRKRSFVTGV